MSSVSSTTPNLNSNIQQQLPNKSVTKAQILISKVISAIKEVFIAIKHAFTNIAAYASKTFTAMFSKVGARKTTISTPEIDRDTPPKRFEVPEEFRDFNAIYDGYNPPEFSPTFFLDGDNRVNREGTLADPANFSLMTNKTFMTLEEAPVSIDSKTERPLNPMGRTGVTGIGFLPKWGANRTVNPIITRLNTDTQNLELLLTHRTGSDKWMLPEQMLGPSECDTACIKECVTGNCVEETKTIYLNELKNQHEKKYTIKNTPTYQDIVFDDSRNTDNAWIEATAIQAHTDEKQQFKDDSDAKETKWEAITPTLMQSIVLNHSKHFHNIVLNALKDLPSNFIEPCKNKDQILGLEFLEV